MDQGGQCIVQRKATNSLTKLDYDVDVGHPVFLHVGHHIQFHVGYHNVNCNWSIPCILGLECLAQVGLMQKFEFLLTDERTD